MLLRSTASRLAKALIVWLSDLAVSGYRVQCGVHLRVVFAVIFSLTVPIALWPYCRLVIVSATLVELIRPAISSSAPLVLIHILHSHVDIQNVNKMEGLVIVEVCSCSDDNGLHHLDVERTGNV